MTCKECKHWKLVRSYFQLDDGAREDMVCHSPAVRKTLSVYNQMEETLEFMDEEERLLLTPPNFGCVHFQPK